MCLEVLKDHRNQSVQYNMMCRRIAGRDEAGTLALGGLEHNSVGASEGQRAPSCSGSSREQSDDELLANSSKRHPIKLPELTEPLRQSGSFRRANSSSLQRMFSRPRRKF